eukprot:241981-Chlamydomonas_euryale.AAC.2
MVWHLRLPPDSEALRRRAKIYTCIRRKWFMECPPRYGGWAAPTVKILCELPSVAQVAADPRRGNNQPPKPRLNQGMLSAHVRIFLAITIRGGARRTSGYLSGSPLSGRRLINMKRAAYKKGRVSALLFFILADQASYLSHAPHCTTSLCELPRGSSVAARTLVRTWSMPRTHAWAEAGLSTAGGN